MELIKAHSVISFLIDAIEDEKIIFSTVNDSEESIEALDIAKRLLRFCSSKTSDSNEDSGDVESSIIEAMEKQIVMCVEERTRCPRCSKMPEGTYPLYCSRCGQRIQV